MFKCTKLQLSRIKEWVVSNKIDSEQTNTFAWEPKVQDEVKN